MFHIVTSAGPLDLPGTARVKVKTGVNTVELPVAGVRPDIKVIVGKNLLSAEQIEANLRRDKRYDDSYHGIHHCEGTTKLRAALFARFRRELSERDWAAKITKNGDDFSPQQYAQLASDIRAALQTCGDETLLRSRDTIRHDWLGGKTLAPKDFEHMFAVLGSDFPELSGLLNRSFNDAYKFYVTVKSAVTRMIGNVPVEDRRTPSRQVNPTDSEPSLIKRLARQYIEEVGCDAVAARVLSIEMRDNGAPQSDLGYIGTGSILSSETLQEAAVAANIVEKVVQLAIDDALACGAITLNDFVRATMELSTSRSTGRCVIADPESFMSIILQNAIILRYGGNLSFLTDADRIIERLLPTKRSHTFVNANDISKTPTGASLINSWFDWAERGFPALRAIPVESMEASLAGWAERLNALPTELRLLWVLNDFRHRAQYNSLALDAVLWQAAWDNVCSVVHARYPDLSVGRFTRIPISDYRKVRRDKFQHFSRIWGRVEENLTTNPFVDWQGFEAPISPRVAALVRAMAS